MSLTSSSVFNNQKQLDENVFRMLPLSVKQKKELYKILKENGNKTLSKSLYNELEDNEEYDEYMSKKIMDDFNKPKIEEVDCDDKEEGKELVLCPIHDVKNEGLYEKKTDNKSIKDE